MSPPTAAEIALQLDNLVALIRCHQHGIGLPALGDQYAEAHGERIHPRTLFRRLARLIAEGRATVDGAARATRYHALPSHDRPRSTGVAAGRQVMLADAGTSWGEVKSILAQRI